jgi:hypothetical protein
LQHAGAEYLPPQAVVTAWPRKLLFIAGASAVGVQPEKTSVTCRCRIQCRIYAWLVPSVVLSFRSVAHRGTVGRWFLCQSGCSWQLPRIEDANNRFPSPQHTALIHPSVLW